MADKLGVPVPELKTVHPYWLAAARTMLEADGLLRDRQEARREQT